MTTRVTKDLKSVISFIEEFGNKRRDLSHEIDGVVVKVNDINAQKILVLHLELRDGPWLINIHQKLFEPS